MTAPLVSPETVHLVGDRIGEQFRQARETSARLAAQPFVVACTPIRNRSWIVDEHWESLHRQTVTPRALYYLTGDNEDDTEARIERLRTGVAVPDMPTSMRVVNSGSPHWHRSREGERYTGDSHRHLAEVYNELIDDALVYWPQASHLWLVDSDVLPEPGCLELLLAAEVDVIAPVVQHSENAFNFMMGWNRNDEPYRNGNEGWYARNGAMVARAADNLSLTDPSFPFDPEPFPATFVSCCVLYRREVLERREPWNNLRTQTYTDENGVRHAVRRSLSSIGLRGDEPIAGEFCHRFAPHPRSHDLPMMASLRAAGVELWVHPRARAEHRMKEPAVA